MPATTQPCFSVDFLDPHLALLLPLSKTAQESVLKKTSLFARQDKVLGAKELKDNRAAFDAALGAAKNSGNDALVALLMYSNGKYKEALAEIKKASQKSEAVLWTRLHCQILTEAWDSAVESLFALKDVLDVPGASQKQLLYKRSYWVHSSLFLLGHASPAKLNDILDVYLAWINAIQTTCPSLERYIAYLLVLDPSRSRSPHFKDIAKLIHSDAHLYSDAFTRLVSTVLNVNFVDATAALGETVGIFGSDYFLPASLKDAFLKSARLFVFELYSRIHSSVSFESAAKLLHLSLDQVKPSLQSMAGSLAVSMVLDNHTATFKVARPTIHEVVAQKTAAMAARAHAIQTKK
ncbi:Eukaryotic translation initiation factor 3 subunit E [Kappamyces sp. JEL0829]|nr:Eukaryotic translation initiation factor 3 subunit E [Kappamyces sp. JEL0829]